LGHCCRKKENSHTDSLVFYINYLLDHSDTGSHPTFAKQVFQEQDKQTKVKIGMNQKQRGEQGNRNN
jgi:hypothetical protein